MLHVHHSKSWVPWWVDSTPCAPSNVDGFLPQPNLSRSPPLPAMRCLPPNLLLWGLPNTVHSRTGWRMTHHRMWGPEVRLSRPTLHGSKSWVPWRASSTISAPSNVGVPSIRNSCPTANPPSCPCCFYYTFSSDNECHSLLQLHDFHWVFILCG
jgi:hypothetical protein